MIKTIFVVDDDPITLEIIRVNLEEHYRVITMTSADNLFDRLDKIDTDLIILDIMMPGMDGIQVIRQLKSIPRFNSIPVMFLTGMNDQEKEAECFRNGAVDFLQKPFHAEVLYSRVKMHIDIEELIEQHEHKFMVLRDSLIGVLADLVENRDMTTGTHADNTTRVFKKIVKGMIKHQVYYDEIKHWDLNVTVPATQLHDIGKITISDVILNKPDKLTPEEYNIIKNHAARGEHIIDQIIKRSEPIDFLEEAKIFAISHHEKWDGTGYPYGLKGLSIPLRGRILAIADVYDAIRSERPYKKAKTHEEAVKIIEEGNGTFFDPTLVEVFLKIAPKLES